MIYTSNKPQAKRITTRTWSSSTDITNIQKELLPGPGQALLMSPI